MSDAAVKEKEPDLVSIDIEEAKPEPELPPPSEELEQRLVAFWADVQAACETHGFALAIWDKIEQVGQDGRKLLHTREIVAKPRQ